MGAPWIGRSVYRYDPCQHHNCYVLAGRYFIWNKTEKGQSPAPLRPSSLSEGKKTEKHTQ
jgi:hypothetical protein